MTIFTLVHGSGHGPWCWTYIKKMLAQRGHRVVTPSLPIEERDAGATRYAKAIAAGMPIDNEVVLVVHSMSGLAAPLVPDLRPVRQIVYLAALLPDPGRSWRDVVREDDAYSPEFLSEYGSLQCSDHNFNWWPEDIARELFYPDCDSDVSKWAVRKLRRQSRRPYEEVTPVQAFPDVPSAYIRCLDDQIIDVGWVDRAVEEHLRTTPLVIGGGHSPFLSRPDDLADLLEEFT